MKTYIIGDCHGNFEGLFSALERHGIIDHHGNRQLDRRHHVMSIGDLANCVKASVIGDRDCLDLVGSVIDSMLVGNHEIPYFDPNNRFSGFHYYHDIDDRLKLLHEGGRLLPCWLLANGTTQGTLVSHAGISRQFTAMYGKGLTADDIHERVQREWEDQNYKHSIFSSIGYARYGRAPIGGMLWCDFDKEFVPTDFPQIVGHTIGGVRMHGNALCIDVGSKNPEVEPFILEVNE